jgi:hypothetical protein
MADCQRQGVSGIGRLRYGIEPKQPLNHEPDLSFIGSTVAGDSGLDLTGRMQGHRQTATSSTGDRNGTCLGSAHDGSDIMLAKDAFDGHGVWIDFVENLFDTALDG